MGRENKIEAVGVQFPEQDGGTKLAEKICQKLEEFTENHPAEFTAEEEEHLIETYEELDQRGLRGILHVIHQGSHTGDMVTNALPGHWRERFYQRLHVIPAEMRGKESEMSSKPAEGDESVYISQDGRIDEASENKLARIFKDRVGILSGGGIGSPKDPIYAPLLKVMERELFTKTPGAGICLGHQLFGELILNRGASTDQGVVPGYLEAITSVEEITPKGRENPVFGRLGDRFTTFSFNGFHLLVPGGREDTFEGGKVLSRKLATGYPSSLSLDAEVSDQVITTQRHPEVGMKGVLTEMLPKDQTYRLAGGKKVILPKGSHTNLVPLANFITSNFELFKEKYGFTEDDVQEMFLEERMATHLGQDFYGPLMQYLADLRMKQ